MDDKTVALLRGQLYNSEKKEPAANLKKGEESPKGNTCPSENTAEKVAAQTGVSPRTVRNDAKLAKAAEELGITADIVAGKCRPSANCPLEVSHEHLVRRCRTDGEEPSRLGLGHQTPVMPEQNIVAPGMAQDAGQLRRVAVQGVMGRRKGAAGSVL